MMVILVKSWQFGEKGKGLMKVLKREVEEVMHFRPSYTIALEVQTEPIGEPFEAGRIDWLPPHEYPGGVGMHPANLHSHQRYADRTNVGALMLEPGEDVCAAVRSVLLQARAWVIEGGFQVKDDFSNDKEFNQVVDHSMVEFNRLVG